MYLECCSRTFIDWVFIIFTPLRYVPNVAKRSIWDQCKKYILRTDRPKTDQRPTSHVEKNQMAISQQGIVRSTSCLVLLWGFRGRRIEWRYFWFDQIEDSGSAAILENSNCDISATVHPINSMFGARVGFLGLPSFTKLYFTILWQLINQWPWLSRRGHSRSYISAAI